MKKILYYPLFPGQENQGADRGEDVKFWVDNYLVPAGAVTYDEEKANAYLVVGGDGALMKAAREKHSWNKILFGVNRGTFGFLLNPVEKIDHLPLFFEDLQMVELGFLRGTFFAKNGEEKTFVAFNDIFCGGNIADYISFSIAGELKHFPARKVAGNGIVISTAQGTTAFALKARGTAALLPLDSKYWFISGVATGPYPSDQVTPQRIVIDMNSRGVVNGYADGYSQEVKNINRIIIEPTDKKIKIAFLRDVDFAARRTSLAQKLERGEI